MDKTDLEAVADAGTELVDQIHQSTDADLPEIHVGLQGGVADGYFAISLNGRLPHGVSLPETWYGFSVCIETSLDGESA